MEIILKEFVPNVGERDELVVVRRGYAMNYLIPQGKAVAATPAMKKQHAETLRQRKHKEAKLRDDAQVLATKLGEVTLKIGAKASQTGKIFGSVNAIQIAEALHELGYEVDRRRIQISSDAVKELGTYKATVKLHKEVDAEIEFEVVAE